MADRGLFNVPLMHDDFCRERRRGNGDAAWQINAARSGVAQEFDIESLLF